jgi:hypothetical protein
MTNPRRVPRPGCWECQDPTLLVQNPLRNVAARKVIQAFFKGFKFAIAVLVVEKKRFYIVCVLGQSRHFVMEDFINS